MTRRSLHLLHRFVLCVLIAFSLAGIAIGCWDKGYTKWTPIRRFLAVLSVEVIRSDVQVTYATYLPCKDCDGSAEKHDPECPSPVAYKGPGWGGPPQFDFARIRYATRSDNGRRDTLVLSGWTLAVLFGIYPLLYFGPRALRSLRRRPKPGHCVKCGYNLTGLPSPRCPECGTAQPEPAGEHRP